MIAAPELVEVQVVGGGMAGRPQSQAGPLWHRMCWGHVCWGYDPNQRVGTDRILVKPTRRWLNHRQ